MSSVQCTLKACSSIENKVVVFRHTRAQQQIIKSINFIDFFDIERIFCSLGPSWLTWKLGHHEISGKFFPMGSNLRNSKKLHTAGFLDYLLMWTKMELKKLS